MLRLIVAPGALVSMLTSTLVEVCADAPTVNATATRTAPATALIAHSPDFFDYSDKYRDGPMKAICGGRAAEKCPARPLDRGAGVPRYTMEERRAGTTVRWGRTQTDITPRL